MVPSFRINCARTDLSAASPSGARLPHHGMPERMAVEVARFGTREIGASSPSVPPESLPERSLRIKTPENPTLLPCVRARSRQRAVEPAHHCGVCAVGAGVS